MSFRPSCDGWRLMIWGSACWCLVVLAGLCLVGLWKRCVA